MNSKRVYHASDVTIAVLNYNGKELLPACISSIDNLVEPASEVILVDDGSTDGSVAWIGKFCPGITIYEMETNTGLLNKVRNRALREARSELVLLVDNDVALKRDCLAQLLWGLNNLPDASVCIPRALYASDPNLIYQDGQTLNFIGATPVQNRQVSIQDLPPESELPKISVGWGVQLIHKGKAAEIGYFNESYAMGWGDDGEFNHKMNLSGNFCYHVPSAIVYHQREDAAGRVYGGLRNRWQFLLECYRWRTLILCLPALVAYEAAVVLFLLSKGSAGDYFRAVKYIVSNLGSILATRRKVQSLRELNDGELLDHAPIYIANGFLNKAILRFGYKLLDSFLGGYWLLVRKLI